MSAVRLGALLLCCSCATVVTTSPASELVADAGRPPLTEDEVALALPVAPDAPFRATKPETSKAPVSFMAPVPVEVKLANGARALVVENHALPLVAIDVAIPIGADVVPLDRAGLSAFVAAMLTEGTKGHDRLQLAEALDDLAVTLDSTSDRETVHVRLEGLRESMPQAIALLAEVLISPAFNEADVARVRGAMQTKVLQRKAWPAAVAFDAADRLLYGEKHPLGIAATGTRETLDKISAADLKAFHARWYEPSRAVIGVSGDLTVAEVKRLLGASLGGWGARPSVKPRLPALPPMTNRVVLIDLPDVSQSEVWLVSRLVPARDADAVPAMVVNNTLGGFFTSRLNMNLREAKGWSYGVNAAADLLRTSGMFELWGAIETPHAAEALGEYFKELELLAAKGLRPGELESAKAAVVRGLPSRFETNSAAAGEITTLALNGLPLDYFARLPELVTKVTERDVARVVSRYLSSQRMSAIVVGPRETSEAALRALNRGKVELAVP